MVVAVSPEINQVLAHMQRCRDSRLHRLLRRLLSVCQVFGVAPLQNGNSTTTKALRKRLYHVWCALLLLYIYVVNYLQSIRIPSEKSTAEKALYFSVFLTNCAIVAVTVVSAQCNGQLFRTLPRELMHLAHGLHHQQQQLQSRHTHHFTRKTNHKATLDTSQLHRELRNLTALISGFLFLCFVLNLVLVKFGVLDTLRSSGAYNLPQVLISLNLGQHWLGLRFIKQLYGVINECLEELLARCRVREQLGRGGGIWSSGFPPCEQASWFRREFLAARPTRQPHDLLEEFRKMYAQLDVLMSSLVEAFGVVLLLNLLATFNELSIELFSIYKYCDRPQEYDIVLVVYKVLWIILHVGRMFFILLPNYAIIKELNSVSNDVERTINRFLMQLMVRNKAESACGIVDLDLMLLGGMISALSMFIIFLIQIDLDDESAIDVVVNSSIN